LRERKSRIYGRQIDMSRPQRQMGGKARIPILKYSVGEQVISARTNSEKSTAVAAPSQPWVVLVGAQHPCVL